ncbi:hypothetical protein BC835DRAFT_1412776 [Cytidiella melzeri]|nr:hypothetical protein BC835DRAFT_1412776 [Cytidiella melzeri]
MKQSVNVQNHAYRRDTFLEHRNGSHRRSHLPWRFSWPHYAHSVVLEDIAEEDECTTDLDILMVTDADLPRSLSARPTRLGNVRKRAMIVDDATVGDWDELLRADGDVAMLDALSPRHSSTRCLWAADDQIQKVRLPNKRSRSYEAEDMLPDPKRRRKHRV